MPPAGECALAWFRRDLRDYPVTQSEKFDPDGKFIRRYVPELAYVPPDFVHAPWRMGAADQEASGCVIGRDYPAPVVDRARARAVTLELYGRARKR